MKIWTFEGGFDENLTYLFSDGNGSEAAIVDAAVPLSVLLPTVEEKNLLPSKLLVTHTHFDHIAHLDEYAAAFPKTEVCIMNGSGQWSNNRSLADGDTIKVGNLTVTALHTPGHTQDSTCFLVEDALFSGDTIFVGRTGRTISGRSDTRQLYRSITKKLLTLPENTVIYPGHDYGPVQKIPLKENIEMSPLLKAADEDDFVRRMDEYERSR
ncbi:MAG: hypothetical protein CMG71_02970 [Candidatus Marinimicrobia bacterium]|nr:hypothetical protein [Candidatus Neomarinimicrobiota bacterium]